MDDQIYLFEIAKMIACFNQLVWGKNVVTPQRIVPPLMVKVSTILEYQT